MESFFKYFSEQADSFFYEKKILEKIKMESVFHFYFSRQIHFYKKRKF